jgi:hypothetical protein
VFESGAVGKAWRRFTSALDSGGASELLRVNDANRQAISWHYFRNDENTARQAKVLTQEEARKMAVNFARMPELLGRHGV